MQKRHIYEYAIIRLNPKVNRGECINVGIIIYCRDLKYIKAKIFVDELRLLALFPSINLDTVEENLRAFEHIVNGCKVPSPIAEYDDASRFRWLTARRSTIIQCGAIHSGLTTDADQTLIRLYKELVEV